MSAIPTPPPSGPITTPPITITWGHTLTILVGLAAGFGGLAYLLFGVIYADIKDEIKETKDNIKSLSDSYRDTITSGIKVQDLLTKSPSIEKNIAETHDAVIKLQAKVDIISQKIDEYTQKNEIHLNNIQKQVHSIPGVPK